MLMTTFHHSKGITYTSIPESVNAKKYLESIGFKNVCKIKVEK